MVGAHTCSAVVRMATMAQGGRISTEIVEEEIQRLGTSWASLERQASEGILPTLLNSDQLAQIDVFHRAQLAHVVQICQQSRSLSDAGRKLFGASRAKKTSTNDTDRLRKYLARFGIEWTQIASG